MINNKNQKINKNKKIFVKQLTINNCIKISSKMINNKNYQR